MRRRTGEINAGSMADIAFLLLIFFLVATTMEVDAGIGRNLTLKKEFIHPPPPIPERDVLRINVNSNNELRVEDQIILMGELEEVCFAFYEANSNGSETDITMPSYKSLDENDCIEKIINLQQQVDGNPHDKFAKSELERWQARLRICQLNNGMFNEISTRSIVRISNQAETKYGTYIAIQNTLRKVVNELRQEKCDQFGWGKYFEIDEKSKDGEEKIRMLRLMVPERIIEAKIEK